MKKQLNISISPQQAANEKVYTALAAKKLRVKESEISGIQIRRKSVDARKRDIKINLTCDVYIGEKKPDFESPQFDYPSVASSPEVLVVGAGPAGLFAALRLIEHGLKPIVIERGKNVKERKKDISAIHNQHIIDPDSNYGYGEGGAGTFSDGKIYTRSKKRGNMRKILEVLHFHGAQDEILIDAHPHIGTNVLPKVVTNIRESILSAGGEVHFETKVEDFILDGDRIAGVKLRNGETVKAQATILATGHSARDMYELLHRHGIELESKTFAMGVRLEHPQELIDQIQYHGQSRGDYLPPASYSFVEQVQGRGVYSFCMCPGGVIVPAATQPGELVVNGMSPSSRGGKLANAGLVVEIRPEDIPGYEQHGAFSALKFQEHFEKLAFAHANQTQNAPAQRMVDFVNGKVSQQLNQTSFRPGLTGSNFQEWMPEHILTRLQQGLKQMGKRARGFYTNEAQVIGAESRTSSPVRIPRDRDTLEHIRVKGLFPSGEGAGYAGGIVSSAVDGERCADMVAHHVFGKELTK